LKQIVAEFIPESNPDIVQLLNEIRSQNVMILSQNDQIISEQVAMSTKLSMIEKRLENLEANSKCEIDVSNFTINEIKNSNEFVEFLKKIDQDQGFRSKCVRKNFISLVIYVCSLSLLILFR
jgi:hypothetical protein